MNCKECLKEFVLKKMVEARAFEKYEYRKIVNLEYIVDDWGNLKEITAIDDYLEAEQEIIKELAQEAVDSMSKDIQQKNDNL